MLRLELLVLCDHALTSKEGKLSIIGIFDRMFVKKVPTVFARFFIVAVLHGEPNSEHRLTLSLKDPQGKEVLPESKKITIRLGSHGRSNIITDIVNMPIPMAGEYTIAIGLEHSKLAEKKLGILLVAPGDDREEKLPN